MYKEELMNIKTTLWVTAVLTGALLFAACSNPVGTDTDTDGGVAGGTTADNSSDWVQLGTSSLPGYNSSIAFDSSDNLYVVFDDQDEFGNATVMKYDSGYWTAVGARDFSASQANRIEIAFDSQDTPYVVYPDGDYSDKATMWTYDGSSWGKVGNSGFSPQAAGDPVIAFAPDDTPYIAYGWSWKTAGTDELMVMKFNGSSWEEVGTASLPYRGTAAYSPSLAFDSNGVLHVAFGTPKPEVWKYSDSGGWVQVGTTLSNEYADNRTALAFDSSDTPYVGYSSDSGHPATVMQYSGSSWVNFGAEDFTTRSVSDVQLAVDQQSDSVFIAFSESYFEDNVYKSMATVMKNDGSGWMKVAESSISTDLIEHLSLALDSSGNPYVSYTIEDELFVAAP